MNDRPDILNQKWYLLGQPWCSSVDAGTVILSGSEDPHAAIVVCDVQPEDDDGNVDIGEARDVAEHIVQLHNASLWQPITRSNPPWDGQPWLVWNKQDGQWISSRKTGPMRGGMPTSGHDWYLGERGWPTHFRSLPPDPE